MDDPNQKIMPGNREFQALIRHDLGAFIEKAFRELSPAQPYTHNWHIDALAFHLTGVMRGRIKRLLITVPPRSLKSHSASIAFPAWLLGHEPHRRIICVSYADELAVEHANAFRKLIRTPWYAPLFPAMQIDARKDTEREVRTTRGGYRMTTTTGGSLTGRGGSVIIIDDPMKANDAESDTVRDRIKVWYDKTLLTRLDDKRNDSIILVMQRLHVDDLAGHVLEKEGWVHLNLPAIAEEHQSVPTGFGRIYARPAGEVLHPGRESLADLERLKADMGSTAFSAQYQQAPVPAGGDMIKWKWFNIYAEVPARKYPFRIVQSWDTASKAGELNDYSVGITALMSRDTVYLLDIVRERLIYPDLKKRILFEKVKWNADNVLIEDKGSGMSLIQDLRKDGCMAKGIDVVPDKKVRMAAVSARIERGEVFLPVAARWLNDFRNEMLAFPNSKHDDQADALSQLLGWKSAGSLYTKESIG